METNPESRDESPDLSDPRYLDEIGYFLYYEKEMRWTFSDYDEERRTYSRLHLDEVLDFAGESVSWIRDKRVVNIGAGCSSAILAWPCRGKIAIDPLIDIYSRLGMLLDDEPNTPVTAYVAASAEKIPLAGESCDLAYCRNALDHMHNPVRAIGEIARITISDGFFFLDADLDGDPTPDEPSSLSEDEISDWIEPWFDVLKKVVGLEPFSINSRGRIRLLLRRNKKVYSPRIDKSALLDAYKERVEKMKRKKSSNSAPNI